MKKRVLAVCLASFFSINAFALVPAGNDVTTKPDLYYLTNAQAIDSLALLPPPPEVGSIAFLNDQAMYEKGRLLRGTERGKLAAEDANLSGGGVATCNTKEQDTLSKNGSYPSGHTSIGWATALVLAEINPQRQNEILKRGFELGESRVICGYHWQSDVDAARIVGSAVVATLHTNPAFQQQLQKAKDEFAKRQK